MWDNFFDETGVYTYSLPAVSPFPAENAVREETALNAMIPPGTWAIRNPKNTSVWKLVEDHRRHTDEKGSLVGGTPFWLPGDKYEAPARYMETPGPLPEKALLEPPAMSPEQQAAAKREEIVLALASLDAQYLTPRVLAGLAAGDEYAKTQYAAHEAEAAELRQALADLGA